MNLGFKIISKKIIQKLVEKHQVTIDEITECFLNRVDGLLEDKRLYNKTEPPTYGYC